MSLTNTAKPGALGMANTARADSAELWLTITTTWASETRTWLDMSSVMDNVSRVTANITNTSKPA